MKSLTIGILALFATLNCHAQAQPQTPSRTQEGMFIRPALFHTHDTRLGATSGGKNGFTISGGLIKGNHEFSAEIGHATTANSTYQPLPWINYRYYLPLGLDNVKLHVGPTIGGTYLTNDNLSDSNYAFNYGVGGGITVLITEKLALDANYRFMLHQDLGLGTSSAASRPRNQHVLTGGLSYSF